LLEKECDGNDASGRGFCVKKSIFVMVRGKVVARKKDIRRMQVCVR
jgi:hypothetical protein